MPIEFTNHLITQCPKCGSLVRNWGKILLWVFSIETITSYFLVVYLGDFGSVSAIVRLIPKLNIHLNLLERAGGFKQATIAQDIYFITCAVAILMFLATLIILARIFLFVIPDQTIELPTTKTNSFFAALVMIFALLVYFGTPFATAIANPEETRRMFVLPSNIVVCFFDSMCMWLLIQSFHTLILAIIYSYKQREFERARF